MKVEWRTNEKSGWCDLIDPDKKCWQVTYRTRRATWEVMYPDSRNTEYVPIKYVTEQQLRDKLRMEYLLTRGET